MTSSGRGCVRWDEVQGAFRDYIRITFLALPDRNASNAKNFCRNPNNDSRGVWCFVNLLGNVQFCNVPRCSTSETAQPPTTTTTMATKAATTSETTTPEISAGVSIEDYAEPVIMTNKFEELSAAKETDSPISPPSTIRINIEQPSEGNLLLLLLLQLVGQIHFTFLFILYYR